MSAADPVAFVRRGAGLFRLSGRGVLAVTGDDRVRWLDGMLSNDVRVLEPDSKRSGCHAVLLTAQGRVVADLHVLARKDGFWLETAASAVDLVVEAFERHIIADDVAIVDLSGALERLAVEGPRAREVIERAAGGALALEPHGWREVWIADSPVSVARYGFSGEDAYQLFAPLERGEPVAHALLAANPDSGLAEAGSDVLEILRVEAGTPAIGSELDTSVLPAEANLEDAISLTKGCYVGQEVVARMHSRGRVSHRLVGLRLAPGELPEPGAALRADDKTVGELTSVCESPTFGPIALGYVRSAHAEPGEKLDLGGERVRVSALPFWQDRVSRGSNRSS